MLIHVPKLQLFKWNPIPTVPTNRCSWASPEVHPLCASHETPPRARLGAQSGLKGDIFSGLVHPYLWVLGEGLTVCIHVCAYIYARYNYAHIYTSKVVNQMVQNHTEPPISLEIGCIWYINPWAEPSRMLIITDLYACLKYI